MIKSSFVINAKQLENAIHNSIKKNISSKVVQRAKDSIRDTVRYSVNTILRENVSKYAPSYSLESTALNVGIDDKNRLVGQIEGQMSSRFMKSPEFMYVKDAIEKYAQFNMRSSESGDLFNLTFSLSPISKHKINDVIGFAWMKKIGKTKGLERRTTLDSGAFRSIRSTWSQLLDMWEFGGTNPVYTVRPRDAGGKLRPGPDKRIASSFVTKAIPPQRMFYLGMRTGRAKIMKLIEQNLKKRFSK